MSIERDRQDGRLTLTDQDGDRLSVFVDDGTLMVSASPSGASFGDLVIVALDAEQVRALLEYLREHYS